jgi:hypothetical protein
MTPGMCLSLLSVVTAQRMVQVIGAFPNRQHYFFCRVRICTGGVVGEFGFETIVGGFFTLPGPTTFRGGPDELGWPGIPMDDLVPFQ